MSLYAKYELSSDTECIQTLFGCMKRNLQSAPKILLQNKRVRTQNASRLNLVLVARLELARYCYRGILSPFVSADSTIPAWNVCYYIISKLQKQVFYFVIFIFSL